MATTASGTAYTPRTWTNGKGDQCIWAVADRLRYTPHRKPTLLYCHGNGGTYDYFTTAAGYQPLRDLLIDNGWVYIETLGLDESHWGREFAIESYAAAATEAATKHPLGPLVIHGRSMGGTVASSLAVKSQWGLKPYVAGLLLESAVQDMYDRHVVRGYSLNGQYPSVAARYAWSGTAGASTSAMYAGQTLTRTNLCTNPAPASATGFVLTGTVAEAGTPTLTFNSSGKFVRSTLSTASTESSGMRTPLAAAAAGNYALRMQVRASVVGVNITVRGEMWTSTDRLSNGSNATLTSTGGWQDVTTTLTVSGSATHLRVAAFYLYGQAAGATLDVRYVLYETGSTAGAYFDGDTTDPNLQAFIDAVAPFNPIQFDTALYAGMPVQFVHGDADDNVTPGPNPQAQLARISGVAAYANLVLRPGGTHAVGESADLAFVNPAWEFVRRAQGLNPTVVNARSTSTGATMRGLFYTPGWRQALPLTA